RNKDPVLALRFKFIFNAIETVSTQWDMQKSNKDNSAYLKNLAYVAVWAKVFPELKLGKLTTRNHFAHSISNLFEDRIFLAYIRNTFYQMLQNLKEPDVNGYALIEKFTK